MKASKTITDITKTKETAKVPSAKVLGKLKLSGNLNFKIKKDINIEETEIRITVKGNELIAKLYLKGVPLMQQVVLVKPIPSPPPIKPQDYSTALGRLRLKVAVEG